MKEETKSMIIDIGMIATSLILIIFLIVISLNKVRESVLYQCCKEQGGYIVIEDNQEPYCSVYTDYCDIRVKPTRS